MRFDLEIIHDPLTQTEKHNQLVDAWRDPENGTGTNHDQIEDNQERNQLLSKLV